MTTPIKSASIKVMRSHDYCHFEVSLSIENENGLSTEEIDNARKEAAKLTDKAVDQYKSMKSWELKRLNSTDERRNLEREVSMIRTRPESEWSPLEKAKVKTLADYNFESRFAYDDDLTF